jgi:hypothetical protein
MTTTHSSLTDTIVEFLRAIGLEVRMERLPAGMFLPGILIDRGTLVVDTDQLRFPGDLLHEAGHIAVAAPERRSQITGDVGSDAAEEMMAIAWSYAAVVHLQIQPEVVFHAEGYRGGSTSLIENFSAGHSFGVPVLQWLGMTYDARNAAEHGVEPYPHMIAWLRPR